MTALTAALLLQCLELPLSAYWRIDAGAVLPQRDRHRRRQGCHRAHQRNALPRRASARPIVLGTGSNWRGRNGLHRTFGATDRRRTARYRPRPVRGRCWLRPSVAHARGTIRARAWPYRFDRYECGESGAGRGRGMDVGRCRRHSADRFPPYPHRRPRSVSPADPRHGSGALCRRAGRRGVRHRPVSRRGRRRPGDGRGRRSAGSARRHRRAGRI